MKIAKMHVTPELLLAILPLPAGTRITEVSMIKYADDLPMIEFLIESPALEHDVQPGEDVPTVAPRFVENPRFSFLGWK